ncbi:MAG: HlyD family efflux transporter periplasmic adaptor subunit [Pirellulales bacterium]
MKLVMSVPQNVLNYVIPILILAVGGIGFVVLSGLKKAPDTRAKGKQPPSVETRVVAANEGAVELQVDGEVIPFREVTLSAEVDGRIAIKGEKFLAGRYVDQDDLLLAIDPRDYEFELQRLAELQKQARSNKDEVVKEQKNTAKLITLAEESWQLEKKEFLRIHMLHRRGVATESELDGGRRRELMARNSLQTLKNTDQLLIERFNRLISEEAQIAIEIKKAELDRERTEIRAPVSGIVIDDPIEKDAYVTRGTVVARIEDTTKVEVAFNIRLDRLRWLWKRAGKTEWRSPQGRHRFYELPPAHVDVVLEFDDQKFRWQGQLSRYDGTGINAATRTVPCIAVVDHPRDVESAGSESRQDFAAPPALMRGMFVKLIISVPSDVSLLSIPEAAIRPGNKVWIYRDGVLDMQSVRVVHVVAGNVLVVQGQSTLSAGDRVIVSPLAIAVDGMSIHLVADRKLDGGSSPNNEGLQE